MEILISTIAQTYVMIHCILLYFFSYLQLSLSLSLSLSLLLVFYYFDADDDGGFFSQEAPVDVNVSNSRMRF